MPSNNSGLNEVYWGLYAQKLFLVEGLGYTKRPLGHRVAYPTKIKFIMS